MIREREIIGTKIKLDSGATACRYPSELAIGEHKFTSPQPALERPIVRLVNAGETGEVIGIHRWLLDGFPPQVNMVVAWSDGTASILPLPEPVAEFEVRS